MFEIPKIQFCKLENKIVALDAKKSKFDRHTLVASKHFNVSPIEVTKQMRDFIKWRDFGIMYGGNPDSIFLK